MSLDAVTIVVLLLLTLGVIGSVIPMVPSGLFSLAGVIGYALWGPTDLGWLLFGSFLIVAIVAVFVEQIGGVVAARATGTTTRTAVVAALVGIVLFVFTGPIGILIGVFGTVVAFELRRGVDLETACKRAGYTIVGMFGSMVAQVLFTLSILVGFVVFVVL